MYESATWSYSISRSTSHRYDSLNWDQDSQMIIQLTQELILVRFGHYKRSVWKHRLERSWSYGKPVGSASGEPNHVDTPYRSLSPVTSSSETTTAGTGARNVWKDDTPKSDVASSFFMCWINIMSQRSEKGDTPLSNPPITFTSKSNSSMIDFDFAGGLSAWSACCMCIKAPGYPFLRPPQTWGYCCSEVSKATVSHSCKNCKRIVLFYDTLTATNGHKQCKDISKTGGIVQHFGRTPLAPLTSKLTCFHVLGNI